MWRCPHNGRTIGVVRGFVGFRQSLYGSYRGRVRLLRLWWYHNFDRLVRRRLLGLDVERQQDTALVLLAPAQRRIVGRRFEGSFRLRNWVTHISRMTYICLWNHFIQIGFAVLVERVGRAGSSGRGLGTMYLQVS